MGTRAPWHGPDPRRWRRRAGSIAFVTGLGILSTALAPALLLIAAASDLATRRPWPLVRTVSFFIFFLWSEMFGIAVSAAIWLRFVGRWERRRTAWLAANERLQYVWARGLFGVGKRIFGFTTEVEGGEALAAPGKMVVLMRHVSTVDTLVPIVLLAPYGRSFRYVLKRELLMDPCLDIAGHRLPNCFVLRGGANTTEEVRRVLDLASDMGPHDALALFPEGTRFTPEKRARTIDRLREHGRDEVAAFAESLRGTLSPLRAGTLGLVAETKDADLVVIAHRGLEAAGSFKTFVRGGLVGARVRIRIRRYAASQVPRDPEGLARFLMDRWREVDAFVTQSTPPAT